MATYDPKDDPYAEIPVKDFSYTANPSVDKPSAPIQSPKSRTKWIILATAVLAALVIAAALVLVFHHKKTTPTKKSTTKTRTVTNSAPAKSSFGLSFSPSTMYTSSTYNLEVNYPKSWVVSDTSTSLTITSPVTLIKNASGQNQEGKILVSVFNQGDIPAAFGSNSSVAVLNSILINYTNPTQNQSSQTYISFIQYPATTIKGGLDAIYVTGNYGYKYAQTIPNSNISGISPLVVVSFLGCSNADCTNPTNLTISSTEWNNSGFSSLIESILKSFIFN